MAGQDSRLLGRWGEDRAAEYLRRKGYQILAAISTMYRGSKLGRFTLEVP